MKYSKTQINGMNGKKINKHKHNLRNDCSLIRTQFIAVETKCNSKVQKSVTLQTYREYRIVGFIATSAMLIVLFSGLRLSFTF